MDENQGASSPDIPVPESDEVREQTEAERGRRRARWRVRRFYAGWWTIGAGATAAAWWGGPDDHWAFNAVVATYWIAWGTWAFTYGQSWAYRRGWEQGTTVFMIHLAAGRVPPNQAPHFAHAGTIERDLDRLQEAVVTKRDEGEGQA